MSQMKCKRTFAIQFLLLSVLLLNGCIIIKNSPAPGCVKYIGPPMIGGCFGKTALVDLNVEPNNECLAIMTNNCNGGILEINNQCNAALNLGGVTVGKGERQGFDIVKKGDEYILINAGGNFPHNIAKVDENIELEGTLGPRKLTVTFTKTGPLCK